MGMDYSCNRMTELYDWHHNLFLAALNLSLSGPNAGSGPPEENGRLQADVHTTCSFASSGLRSSVVYSSLGLRSDVRYAWHAGGSLLSLLNPSQKRLSVNRDYLCGTTLLLRIFCLFVIVCVSFEVHWFAELLRTCVLGSPKHLHL